MILVSFADSRFSSQLRRLSRQANSTGLYRRVIALNEEGLARGFREKHSAILQPSCRGFGYWIWKPQVILQALSVAQPGEVVNYLDAGFHIAPTGVERLKEYAAMAVQSDQSLLGFKAVPPRSEALMWDGRPLPVWKNREWTKRLLLERTGKVEDETFLDDVAFEAGALFVQNVPEGVAFIESWLALMEEDYAHINDSSSPGGESPDFREHRHDQACFSILAHDLGMPFVSSREFWYPDPRTGRPRWSENPHLPFQARRIQKQTFGRRLRRRILQAIGRPTA